MPRQSYLHFECEAMSVMQYRRPNASNRIARQTGRLLARLLLRGSDEAIVMLGVLQEAFSSY
jgi:hypothetical protein